LVAHYRLYFLDPAGHIGKAVELDCEDDAQAIRGVEPHRDGRAMELWQTDRLVKTYPADRRGAEPPRRSPPHRPGAA
jgi:hypothetical protein